jgi:hypothetical protein
MLEFLKCVSQKIEKNVRTGGQDTYILDCNPTEEEPAYIAYQLKVEILFLELQKEWIQKNPSLYQELNCKYLNRGIHYKHLRCSVRPDLDSCNGCPDYACSD